MTVRIEFTDEHLMVLNKALGELPYKEAAPLIAEINYQIKAQTKPEIDNTPMVLPHHNPTDPAALARKAS